MNDIKHTYTIAGEIITERVRQCSSKGWSEEHDDGHTKGELSLAAAAYALAAGFFFQRDLVGEELVTGVPETWPWARELFKSSRPRRMLVKAAALIVAEIERIDRAELNATKK